MERKHRYFVQWEPPIGENTASSEARDPLREIEQAMAFALTQTLEARPTTSQIIAHSRRVAELASTVARLIDVREREHARLYAAAQLHEIGMVGVPSDLLTRRSRLSAGELAYVRNQARVGAEIVRASHDAGTARLIERQYDDYQSLQRSTLDSSELLLAGILRIADVYDAMATPRPYQDPVPIERRLQILRLGSGTKFHPAVSFALLRLVEAEEA